MKIGVFDSGIGGRSVADSLQVAYPDASIVYVDDRTHVPYGSRSHDEIIQLTDAAIQPLLQQHCDVIVLACNTATAAAIEFLRQKYADMPFVGLEPMVKPAVALSKAGIIAICATPYTLHSERYKNLKQKYAADVTVVEPDCSEWAAMIEHNQVDDAKIAQVVENVCSAGADVIVLACTHYHWIKERINELTQGRATVIDPSDAIASRVGQIFVMLSNDESDFS